MAALRGDAEVAALRGDAEVVAPRGDAEVAALRGDVEAEDAERVANNILSSAVTI